MLIGKLNKRIKFLISEEISDGMGGVELTWKETSPIWGEFRTPRIREQISAGIPAAQLNSEILVRKMNKLPSRGHRALVDGKIFEIIAIYDLNKDIAAIQVKEICT